MNMKRRSYVKPRLSLFCKVPYNCRDVVELFAVQLFEVLDHFLNFSGFLFSASKNSPGVMFRYSHI